MRKEKWMLRGLSLVAVGALWSACFVPDPTPNDGVDVPSNVQLSDNVHIMPYGKPHFLAASGTPHLTYYGGPVIPNVKIVMLNWGSGVTGESTLEQFYTSVTNSAYMDWLSEYNTSSQSIGRGTFGGAVVDPAPPSGSTISDAQIQSEIGTRINDGTLPSNDGNTLYMVHFPPGIKITQGGSSSCAQFCAYHGTFTRNSQNVYYGVIPDMGGACASGCGSASQVQNTEAVSSHEMIEAVTDAAVGLASSYGPPLAWYDQTNGEIGDICNGQVGTINGYYVQKEWSNSQNACIITNGGSTPPPPPPPPPSGTTTLDNGVAVTGLAGAKGSNTMFKIDVPSGASNLKFAISGGSGDADLYVKFGAEPTTSSYDYRPYLTGNNETVTIATPQTGTYYAMINGYAAYSGVQIVASFDTGSTPPPPPPPPPTNNVLSNGVPVTGLSGATGSQVVYTLDVPSGASNLTFSISGGSGDADIYVKFGSAPTTTSYDYRPYLNGNNETVNATTKAGTWYVMINGYAAYSGVTLVGSYDTGGGGGGGGGGGNALTNGVPVTGLSGSVGSQTNFTFDVPAGATSLKFAISGGTGDADIYVKYGSAPTTSSYDYRPYLNGNNETVNATPKAGTWYVMINGYQSFSGVSLVATYQ